MKNFKCKKIVLAVCLSCSLSANAADFTNGGFEDGTTNGWSSGGATMTMPTTIPVGGLDPSNYLAGSGTNTIVGNGFDPILHAGGVDISMSYAGNYAVRVNDGVNNLSVSTINQTVNNYSGSTINFAWFAVLQDSGHPASDAPHFKIVITDLTTSSVVSSIYYSAANSGTFLSLANSQVKYSGWQSESISVTSGHNYNIVLLAADCTQSGHYGYVYLDGFGLVNVSNLLGPTLDDTFNSLQASASQLRGAYNLQSAIINTGLSYDCTTFDKNGICLSAGGRVTDTVNPATNSQGALVIASYRANDNWRIGGYLDQNLSSNDPRGVNLDNSNPMGGVFAVWNQNTDGTGYQVRVAAGYSDKDVTISRSATGLTGEAGTGESSLRAQAYSAIISRGFQINDTRWIASPYLGVRYTKIKRAGYTEDSTTDVTAPLTYSALSQETTTALAGVRFNGQFGDKVNVLASAGVESDIAHNTGDYAATGVSGLTPIAFNENIRHVRPVAQAGVRYAIDKRQTVGANLHFRQEAFNSTHSVTGMVNYELGF